MGFENRYFSEGLIVVSDEFIENMKIIMRVLIIYI